MNNIDTSLYHLTEIVFVRLHHCKVTHFFPLSILYHLEGSHRTQQGVRFHLLKDKVSTELFGIFCMGDLSILLHLLFYCHLYQYGLTDNLFYTLGYNTLLLFKILLPRLFQLWPSGALSVGTLSL